MEWKLADVLDSVNHSSLPLFGENGGSRGLEHTCIPTATFQYSKPIHKHLCPPRPVKKVTEAQKRHRSTNVATHQTLHELIVAWLRNVPASYYFLASLTNTELELS